MGMRWSNRCTIGRSVVHSPSILCIWRVLRALAEPTDEMRLVRAAPAVQSHEILQVQGIEPQTPHFHVSGIIRSSEPRNTACYRNIPQYTGPKFSEYTKYNRVPVISAFVAPCSREYSVVSALCSLGSRDYSVVSALGTREYSVTSALDAPGTCEHWVISACGTPGT